LESLCPPCAFVLRLDETAVQRTSPLHAKPTRFLRPVGAGSARSPLPALKNLLRPEALRRLPDELGDGFRLRNVDRVAPRDLRVAVAESYRRERISSLPSSRATLLYGRDAQACSEQVGDIGDAFDPYRTPAAGSAPRMSRHTEQSTARVICDGISAIDRECGLRTNA
jgi:hypothetical protein